MQVELAVGVGDGQLGDAIKMGAARLGEARPLRVFAAALGGAGNVDVAAGLYGQRALGLYAPRDRWVLKEEGRASSLLLELKRDGYLVDSSRARHQSSKSS